jgi:hypothetical protein
MQHSDAWDVALPDRAFYNSRFDIENNPNEDRWEPWDTYLEIKKPFELPLTFKAGRQRIYYGDKRIFGPGEWGNTGRWIWDAAKLSLKWQKGFIATYYGRTLLHDPDTFSLHHRHGFESAGLYSHFELAKHAGVEPFVMTKQDDHDRYVGGNGKEGELDSYYVGLRSYLHDFLGFDGDATVIVQRGDWSHDDIKAYGYHVLLGYTFKEVTLQPRVSLEYSFGSGDNNPTDGDYETFDGAFGARDKMYGRMNLFHWRNLKDAQANLELKPRKWMHVKAEFHKFWLAEKKDAWYLNPKQYVDRTGDSGDEVGDELDIVARFNLPKGHQIQCGFGHFWPREFAKAQASSKEANWLFFQWMYSFSQPIL